MALAMGLQVAIARLGSAAALVVPPYFATRFSITTPVLLGFILLIIGLLAFIFYSFMDKKLDQQLHIERTESGEEEEGFKLSDVGIILKNKGFWYIALLCVLFYGAVFPFYKYGTDLFVNKFGLPLNWASKVPSIVPFGTIALTPLFGNIYDRKGKGASIMILGSLMLTFVHLVLFAPFITNIWVAAAAVVVLGVAFSLVPSAMWPSVAKIIPDHLLGTAFALIFWIQNIGLGFIPWLLGFVLEKTNPGIAEQLQQGQDVVYNYTPTMFVFVVLSASSIVVAFLLKRDDKKSGYGLELPNMEEKR
jgi:predicted MFS family arabinose efflux permease